jgi:hypothetical protein
MLTKAVTVIALASVAGYSWSEIREITIMQGFAWPSALPRVSLPGISLSLCWPPS